MASMPPLEERLRLAELTMTALARPEASELPSKIGIHPRPADSFAHAMPAHLRTASPARDLVGMKWVAGFPTNNALGQPAISAVVIVNDPETGVPVAILDGAPITAERTAAVSGVALRHFGPRPDTGGGARGGEARGGEARDGGGGRGGVPVAILGAGTQARSHLAVLAGVLPGCRVLIFDRHPERAEALAEEARATDGIGGAEVHETARAAAQDADVVVTVASFGPRSARQALTSEWLRPDATVIAVDYATYVAADVAEQAALFLVDHREQLLANREAGNFDGYPDPGATIGEAILAGTPRPGGRVLVTHLGVGLADLVFADAIIRTATAAGLGTTLPR
jgi:ornithine cyclodeaminase/alanine dehydrogenase